VYIFNAFHSVAAQQEQLCLKESFAENFTFFNILE